MEDPDADLLADADERVDAPDFESLTPPDELVRGDRTRDDFFDAVLGLDEPATVEEVATLADHGTDAAREYLAWFERMGIVERVGETPATYRCNRAYLVWRRVQRLQREYDDTDLVAFLESETERDRAFADRFGADAPDQVRLRAAAAATDTSIEDAWEALSAWRTTRRRIDLLERALAGDDTASDAPPRVA